MSKHEMTPWPNGVLNLRETKRRVPDAPTGITASTTELKPCPFCGGSAEIAKHHKEDMWRLTHRCPIVGVILMDWTAPENRLVKIWNTRHDLVWNARP